MEEIVWLKKRADCILQDCFNDKRALKLESKSSFEFIFNEQNRSDRSSKLLASYINYRLTNAQQADAGGILIDSGLILSLFRAQNSVDIFEDQYVKQLGVRLLQNDCNDLLEKNLADVLRDECSENMTTKVDLMFNELNTSRDLVKHFKDQ